MKPIGCILYLCLILTLAGCGGGSGGSAAVDTHGATTSLQDEVDNLPVEGTLIVTAGIYDGDLRVSDKVVHLQGQAPGAVIDGRGRTCLSIKNASGSTISGFLFVNCEDGILTDSVVTIRNNGFFDNVDGVDYEGGGGLLENNRFHGNRDDAVDLDSDVAVTIIGNLISESGDDGIEIRLHPYEGEVLRVVIEDNVIQSNRGNGIQLIDYEVDTDRSIEIVANTFIDNDYSGIAFADDQNTTPSFEIGAISSTIEIVNNCFYESRYALTGTGVGTVFEGNQIFTTAGDDHLNTTSDLPVDKNLFIPLY